MTKAKIEKQIPCVYAGDPDDEVCIDCNGITMIVDNMEIFCKDNCQAYTAVEEPVKEETKPTKEDKKAPVKDTKKETTSLAVPVTIKAESGLSVELKDRTGLSRWYKFHYTEERTVPADCNIEHEKQVLWNDVNSTVDKQLEDTLLYLQAK